MENKFKDWLKLGFIGYLLSLPILIWRSSRVGKAISLFLLILVSIYFLNFISDWATEAYAKFTLNKEVSQILETSKKLKMKISEADTRLDRLLNRLNNFDNELTETLSTKTKELTGANKDIIADYRDKLDLIERSLDILSATERQAVKDKIIEIKEAVRLHNKSIDSAEIRKQLELVASNLHLLKPEEKERFFKDLEDIGFQVNVQRKGPEIVEYEFHNGDVITADSLNRAFRGWSGVTASAVIVGY